MSNDNWERQRFIFELLKQQTIFRYWKKEQFVCQTGICAWCKKPLMYRYAEVDHIVALFSGGMSDAKNLVLAHHTCNKNKGTLIRYVRPNWIKENKFDDKLGAKYELLLQEHKVEKSVDSAKSPDVKYFYSDNPHIGRDAPRRSTTSYTLPRSVSKSTTAAHRCCDCCNFYTCPAEFRYNIFQQYDRLGQKHFKQSTNCQPD